MHSVLLTARLRLQQGSGRVLQAVGSEADSFQEAAVLQDHSN
jgi:hypothetical protein